MVITSALSKPSKMSIPHNSTCSKLQIFPLMRYSAACVQPRHSSAGFIHLLSPASATRDSHPQPSGGRLTSLCLLSKLTGLPPTRINHNYISSFILLCFSSRTVGSKQVHCHIIYLLKSYTNLSLKTMIYSCLGAAE